MEICDLYLENLKCDVQKWNQIADIPSHFSAG